MISEVDADSGSNGSISKSADSDDATGRKKTNKTVKELRKIRGKHEENSLWLSDFDQQRAKSKDKFKRDGLQR